MLGDTAEKSKNPLKKAMRRRYARTVQINETPTYVEASDYDYSSDEDEGDEIYPNGAAASQGQQGSQTGQDNDDAISEQTLVNGNRDSAHDSEHDLELNGRVDEVESRGRGGEQPRPSDESAVDKQCKPLDSDIDFQRLMHRSRAWQVTQRHSPKHRLLFPR